MVENNAVFLEMIVDGQDSSADQVIQHNLKEHGIAVVHNWASAAELADISAELSALEKSPPSWMRVPECKQGWGTSYLPLTSYQADRHQRCNHLAAMFGSKRLKAIASAYLEHNWEYDRIILARSEISEQAITSWHVDHFQSNGNCLKFYLYVHDIDALGGSFSYIPGWHQLQYELNLDYKTYPERRDNIYEFEELIREGKRKISELAQRGDHQRAEKFSNLLTMICTHIKDPFQSDDHFAVAAPAGTMLMFDSAGLHRGGLLRQGERLIARAHCVEMPLQHIFTSKNEFHKFIKRSSERLIAGVSGKDIFV